MDAAYDGPDSFSMGSDLWRDAFLRVDEGNREALARPGRSDAAVRQKRRVHRTKRRLMGRRHSMNIRIWVAAAILFLTCSLPGYAQEYGRLRALQQRAAHVTNLKNAFVAGVLASYRIEHSAIAREIVVRINIDGRWQDVTAIEIVPVMTKRRTRGGA